MASSPRATLLNVAAPGLGVLGSYGGSTQTVALLPGSPAIGAGVAVTGVTTDQRGDPLDSPKPDIGAFQTGGFTITAVAGSTPPSAIASRRPSPIPWPSASPPTGRAIRSPGDWWVSRPPRAVPRPVFLVPQRPSTPAERPGWMREQAQFQQRLLFGHGDDRRCRHTGRVRPGEPDPTELLRSD